MSGRNPSSPSSEPHILNNLHTLEYFQCPYCLKIIFTCLEKKQDDFDDSSTTPLLPNTFNMLNRFRFYYDDWKTCKFYENCMLCNKKKTSLFHRLKKNYSGFPWQDIASTKTRRGSPVDDRPSTDKLHHFVQKKMDTWHVTRDTLHVTHDTWHVTRDTFGGWTFSLNFSSLALTVCDLWYYEDILGKGSLNNQLPVTRLFVGQPRLHRVCQKGIVLTQTEA